MTDINWKLRKDRISLTGPIRGYVSAEGREAIRRLEQVGFDSDLAFEMVASFMPEQEFYDLDLAEETNDREDT